MIRAKRCAICIGAASFVLFNLSLFLDDPIVLTSAFVLALFLVWRFILFFRSVSDTCATVRILRTPERIIIRQGKAEAIRTDLTISVAPSLHVEYAELISAGSHHLDGELRTGTLKAGTHSIQLQYRFIPLFHGNFTLPGGILSLHDPLFSLEIPYTSSAFTGPTLKVHPQPGFSKISPRNEFGNHEIDRIGPIHGSGIRMYREYVQGDDVRNVDWKLSAKQESLIIREYAVVESFIPLIIMDLPDSDQAFDQKSFESTVGAVSALIDRSLLQRTGTSLLLVSGPNIIDMVWEGRNRAKFTNLIQEKFHPHVRLHHMYRLSRRSILRDRIKKLEQPEIAGESENLMDFSSHLSQIIQGNLHNLKTPDYAKKITHILASLDVQEIFLFSLVHGDISHIQEILYQARRLHIRLKIRTPIFDIPEERARLYAMFPGETIEGLS